jgi:tetratricopeptide (TPR) repeat protein
MSVDGCATSSTSQPAPNTRILMNTARFFRDFLLIGTLVLIGGVARAETPDVLIAEGDAFDKRLQASEALQYYLPADKLEPNDAALLVRIARQYRHLMSDTSSKTEKLRLGRLSLQFANRAVAIAPNSSEAQLSPAISYGKMVPYMGLREQVDATPRIKQAADRALRLDSNNDTAWHILGRWNRTLAGIGPIKRALVSAIYGTTLPVTTNEAAAYDLLKAISINPDRLIHYIELGRIYAQMGRNEDARKFIQKGLSMPNKEKDDPEMKAIGRELLKKLG